VKVIDTRRTVEGLLAGVAMLALAHFIGLLLSFILVSVAYYFLKASRHKQASSPTHRPPPLPPPLPAQLPPPLP
jgi:hypothetical protein